MATPATRPTTRAVETNLEQEFMAAIYAGNERAALAILDENLNMNVNIYMYTETNKLHSSPLQFAAQNGWVNLTKKLVERGADVNYQNAEGRTPAMYAARGIRTSEGQTVSETDRLECLRILAEQGNADLNLRANNDDKQFNNTALHFAASQGQSQIVNYLASRPGVNKNATNNLGNTPLEDAVTHQSQHNKHGNPRIVGQMTRSGFLRNADVQSQNKLIEATNKGDLAAVQAEIRALQTANLSLDGTDNLGFTALHYAARNGNEAITKALLDAGANPNAQNKVGATPLMIAADNNHTNTMNLLLDRGADINLQNSVGSTALHYATGDNKTEEEQLLIERGADVNLANNAQWSPLMYAIHHRQTAEALTLINARDANLNLQNENGDTALIWAVARNNGEVTKALIEKGVNVNLQNKDGHSALMNAVRNGNTELAQALIEAGADVNLQNKDRQTALDMVPQNNEELRKLLTDRGARPGTEVTAENARKAEEEAAAIQRGMAASITLNPDLQSVPHTFEAMLREEAAKREADAAAPKTQEVGIIDFSNKAHTNSQRYTNNNRGVNLGRTNAVTISKDNQATAIRTLQGLEASGALKTDADGQSNAEIYLHRLILVNQMEGKDSPARKALHCLFDKDGNPKTNLSPEDIATIQAGVEYSIQHTRTTRNGRGTDYVARPTQTDYTAKTETREVPESPQPNAAAAIQGQNITQNPEDQHAAPRIQGGAEKP